MTNTTPPSTPNPNVPPPGDRNAWARHLLTVENVNDHDTFIKRMEDEGNNMGGDLNNFVPRLLNLRGYTMGIAENYVALYLMLSGVRQDVQDLVQQAQSALPSAPVAPQQRVSTIRDPQLRAAHEELWRIIQAARALPTPSPSDPNTKNYQEMLEQLTGGERELQLRELCERMEAPLLALAGTPFSHIVGNEPLRTQHQNPQLREILFQMAKDLITNHGYTLDDVWQ